MRSSNVDRLDCLTLKSILAILPIALGELAFLLNRRFVAAGIIRGESINRAPQ